MADYVVVHIACARRRIEQIVLRMNEVKNLGLDPVTVLAALAHDIRWEALRMMAGGASIHATQRAAKFGRDVDGIGKHLRVLKDSGAVDWRAGADARHTLYFIPERFLPQESIVDYGFGKFYFPDAPLAVKD